MATYSIEVRCSREKRKDHRESACPRLVPSARHRRARPDAMSPEPGSNRDRPTHAEQNGRFRGSQSIADLRRSLRSKLTNCTHEAESSCLEAVPLFTTGSIEWRAELVYDMRLGVRKYQQVLSPEVSPQGTPEPRASRNLRE